MPATISSTHTIGQRLKELRLERKLSQREVATAVPLSRKVTTGRSRLSEIERGQRQPTPEELERLAAYFGVRRSYLETGVNRPASASTTVAYAHGATPPTLSSGMRRFCPNEP